MGLDIKRLTSIKTPLAFRERMAVLGLDLPIDAEILKSAESPMAQTMLLGGDAGEGPSAGQKSGFLVGNRYCIHPMEGWDATQDGRPTPELIRRWRRFGESGAKFLWGMEAVAVRPDGRANPNQLMALPETMDDLRRAADECLQAHTQSFGTTRDLLWGLQLTHSGRFCRPRDKHKLEPKIAYAHPILNRKFGLPLDYPVIADDDIRDLIEHYIRAAVLADKAGIPFVDIKQCHGYLGHEFLSAFTRKGPYGGESLENRTRFAREIIQGIRQAAPRLILGVRLSAFDFVPFKPDPLQATGGNLGPGVPEDFSACLPYQYGFGINRANPVEYDLSEPIQYLNLLKSWGVAVVNISAGSPYYNPHIQRPALFPPSDGYQPAEDPVINVARQIDVVRKLKAGAPDMPLVSSGLTYLQEYIPHVSQALIRQGWTDFAGIGRMVLSYPRIIADSLEKGSLETKYICRTFSDCTTAPRNGIKSGCYPLDEYYRNSPEGAEVRQFKKEAKASASANTSTNTSTNNKTIANTNTIG